MLFDSRERIVGGFGCGITRCLGLFDLFSQEVSLTSDSKPLQQRECRIGCCDYYHDPLWFQRLFPPWNRLFGLALAGVGLGLAVYGSRNWGINNHMSWLDRAAVATGCSCFIVSGCILVFGHLWPPNTVCSDQQDKHSQTHTETVSQKVLTLRHFPYYNNYMANVLNADKQIAIISSLCEGSSIRSIERITGVHRDTVMRLGVKVGQGCTALMDRKMRNLDCHRLEMDEIWGYVGKKEKHLRAGDDTSLGNVWTYCAIDADTNLVPTFRVAGDRDVKTTTAFARDVADCIKNRVQISHGRPEGLRGRYRAWRLTAMLIMARS